jgi:hypothetical protein
MVLTSRFCLYSHIHREIFVDNIRISLISAIRIKQASTTPVVVRRKDHMSSKPMGIVILAVLQLLSALAYLAFGFLLLMAILPMGIFAIIFAIAPLIFLIVGIIGLILFYGLWNTKSWAWLWTLIINILGILGGIMDPIGNIVTLAISIIIVIYLFMPTTRAAFK